MNLSDGPWILRRSAEEAVVHALIEARRAAPAILYLPHLQVGLSLKESIRQQTLTLWRMTALTRATRES